MRIKRNYLHFLLDRFPENLGKYTDEPSEGFHQIHQKKLDQ